MKPSTQSATVMLVILLTIAALLTMGCQEAQSQADTTQTDPTATASVTTEEPSQIIEEATAPVTTEPTAEVSEAIEEPTQTSEREETMTTANTEAATIQTGIQAYLGDAFSMPVLSPELTPPPYRYTDDRMINILFATDPQVVEKLVPPPLQPDPTQPMLFYIGKLYMPDYEFSYNEAALAAPVIDQNGQPGYYPIVLYLDKPNPIVGGREIYGFPKKEAEEISFEEENGTITAVVTRNETPVITVNLEVQQKVDPIPPRTIAPWYFLKYIPSAEKDAPPDVLKLVTMGFEPYIVSEMAMGTATLEFGESPYDSILTQIPVNEIFYSEVITSDFTLGYGEVVLDYLAVK